MPEGEILARGSVERIYPRDVHRTEAAHNSHARTTVLRGILIERRRGAGGPVRLVRAVYDAAGVTSTRGTVFLSPYRVYTHGVFSPDRGVHRAVVENVDPFERHGEEYDAFIDRVIAAARELIRDHALAVGPRVALGAPQPLRR